MSQLARKYFYPRPPYGGRHEFQAANFCDIRISIHALRTEGDIDEDGNTGKYAVFLSTPSVRRATLKQTYNIKGLNSISIHALRTEGDRGGELI